MENNKFPHFNLSEGTYSIDDFNAKIKQAVLQQGQGWEAPEVKDLKTGHTRTLDIHGLQYYSYRAWYT